MLCDSCLVLFRGSHRAGIVTNDGVRGEQYWRDHHQSVSDLEHSAAQHCFICDILWRRFLLANGSEFWKHLVPLSGSEYFSKFKIRGLFYSPAQSLRVDFRVLLRSGTLPVALTLVDVNDISHLLPPTNFANLMPTTIPKRQLLARLFNSQAAGKGPNSETPSVVNCTNSDFSLAQAGRWLANCTQSHTKCQTAVRTRSTKRLPKRLIEIGQPLSDMFRVRTLPINKKRKTTYMTLSHCWGLESFFRLTTSTAKDLQSGILSSVLPKSFQHAMHVATKMGVKYIWIDSLCIVQDSKDDWREQSSIMADIYSGSLCNIAAAAASKASDGCFYARPDSLVQPCVIDSNWEDSGNRTYHICDSQMFNNDFQCGPLRSRGWVIQEVLLAPRVLYFHERQIWWECLDLLACETYPRGLPQQVMIAEGYRDLAQMRSMNTHDSTWKFTHVFKGSDTAHLKHAAEGVWTKIVEDYTARYLTRSEDKLVAISGIAKELQKILQDEYLAGLWRGMLPSTLLWHRRHKSPHLDRPNVYRAPSWSWASLNGGIKAESMAANKTLVRIEDIQLTPLTEDLTGEITSGLIRLSGQLSKMEIIRSGSGYICPCNPGSFGGSHGISPRFDTLSDGVVEGSKLYYLLPINAYGSGALYQCLILRPTGQVKGQFQRCGIMTIAERFLSTAQRDSLPGQYETTDASSVDFPYTISIV